ncbi:MAG: 2OG-Fe(II) oxygenase [Vicinamibacterales bacterium]
MHSQQTTSGPDERSVEARDVDVEILLSGGHRFAVTLPSDSIILVNLVRSLAAKLEGSAGHEAALFQIPLQDGRTALTFCDRDLAAITTTPPVLAQAGDPVWRLTRPIEAAPPPPAEAIAIPTPWLQVDDVLAPEDLARLMDFALAREAELRPSGVTTNVEGYRRSRVLFEFPEFKELLLSRVRAYLPTALRALAVPPFHVSRIEAQLTAHNDGDYFKVHPDSGSGDTATREITFVYYFNREPKGYAGGELVLYDSRLVNGVLEKDESFSLIEPRRNSMVLFRSHCHHEVLPVTCPSGAFADSRFTINGWVRRDG